MKHFELRSAMSVSVAALWDWHMRPGAFERLAPPFSEPRVLKREGPLGVGHRVELSVPVFPPFRSTWVSEFVEAVPGEMFRDIQTRGPFRSFDHTHRFSATGDASSLMEDLIAYELPMGSLGSFFGARHAESVLRSTFEYRHRVLCADLAAHARYSSERRLRVLLTGSTGLVGTALTAFLRTGGHDVWRLVRRTPMAPDEIAFDPARGAAHPSELEGFDAVVHLAGASIAEKRWTAAVKSEIRDSRVTFTSRLSETLSALKRPPRVFVSASAIGYYGDRGDRPLRESDGPGQGFLAEVGAQWEAATERARGAGIRVVIPRIGVVLSAQGGALAKMRWPFSLGLGGPLGPGTQWWSWIALDDLLYLILHALMTPAMEGPVNATSPFPVTNAEFARVLGQVLGRPAFVPAPRWALEVVMGEMAGPLLLEGARVLPERALDQGFEFSYPQLELALRHTLGR